MGEIIQLRDTRADQVMPDQNRSFSQIIQDIADLGRDTEEDFLCLGNALQEVSSRSAKISQNAFSASSIMSGDEIKGALEGLKGMVHQLEELFNRADAVSSTNIDSLLAIVRTLRAMETELTGLKDTSRDLKMLALSTKIQSTKTGENFSAFMQLGHDIKEMSGIIASRSSALMEDTVTLGDLVNDAHEDLNDLKTRHKQQTHNVVMGTRNILDGLTFLSCESVDEVAQITDNSKTIRASIDELVVSMQYQDITRQSLDRIMSELEKVQKGELSQVLNEPDNKSVRSMPCDNIILVGICKKQTKCLLDTGNNISSAANSMLLGLDTVILNVEKMASVTNKASTETSRFLLELETGISSVTAFLSEAAESGKEMSDAMASLANTVDYMSEFTGDIEHISSEVELIALNARILAAQGGEGGAGMGVIAGAVQNTANDSEKRRQNLVRLLKEVSTGSVELKGEIEKTTAGEGAEFDQLVRELGVFLDALRTMQRKIVGMLGDIDIMSRDLHGMISSVSSEIEIHKTVQINVMEIILDLEKTAEKFSESISVEELSRFAEGKIDNQNLKSLGSTQKIAVIKDLFTGTGSLGCFEEERAAASTEDVVLF